MEAVALFEFSPSEPNETADQLTFNAGEQINITGFTDAPGWYKAEIHKQYASNHSSPNNSINNSQTLHPNGTNNKNSLISPNHNPNNNSLKSYSSSKLQQSTSRSSNYKTGHNGLNQQNQQNNFQTSSFSSPQHSPHNNSLHNNSHNNSLQLSSNHHRQNSFNSLQSRRSSGTTASQSNFHNRKIVRGFAPKSYFELRPCPWFYGPATREMADEILQSCPEGEFIIRQNVDTMVFCLSVQCVTLGAVQHYKILRDQVGNYLIYLHKFKSLNKLIEYYMTHDLPTNKATLVQYSLVGAPNWQQRSANPEEYLFTAMHDFTPIEAEDHDLAGKTHQKQQIALKMDDKIKILDQRDYVNDGWWLGQIVQNENSPFQVGLFPKDYGAFKT